MQHIYITDYQRTFILIGTTSVLTNTQNVGINANRCISSFCIYVLYRLFSALLWNVMVVVFLGFLWVAGCFYSLKARLFHLGLRCSLKNVVIL